VASRERWEVADARNNDPVVFADYVERTRREHDRLVGRGEST
jgi:hypothetical protein